MTDEELSISDATLIARWDDYVESMGSVMGEVEHMAQQMRDRIEQLVATNEALVKERDKYREAFNTNCLVLRGTEEHVERLEAALQATDQTIMENCVDNDWLAWGEKAVSDIRAALKGIDHDAG